MAADISVLLHDRALRLLREQLRRQRYEVVHGLIAPGHPVAEAGHEGRLLAMERIGAITAKEAAHWRRRLHDAGWWREPAGNPPSEDVRARAADHLEARLEPVSPSARERAAACLSAIGAYEQTGIFTAAEALAWRDRLNAKLGLAPVRPRRCSRRNLLRVVAGPAKRWHGLRVTSVELYDDGVVLQWHHSDEWVDGPATARVWSERDYETIPFEDEIYPHSLTDDLGTCYVGDATPFFGINGGGSIVSFGTSAFTPAVPLRAKQLHAPFWDGAIDIDL